jgi:sulfonate transport system substrate-binding protein
VVNVEPRRRYCPARLQGARHLNEGRDLPFQIDYSSYVTSRKFAIDNPAIVRAIAAAYETEVQWVNANVVEAETLVQKVAKYSDQVRDGFIERKRQYKLIPVTDKKFVAELQTAADWLTERKVLPEKITVADHLANV